MTRPFLNNTPQEERGLFIVFLYSLCMPSIPILINLILILATWLQALVPEDPDTTELEAAAEIKVCMSYCLLALLKDP